MSHEILIGYGALSISIIGSAIGASYYLGRKLESLVSHDTCSKRRDEDLAECNKTYVKITDCLKKHRGK